MVADEAAEAQGGQYKVWVMTINNPTKTAEQYHTAINHRTPVKYMAMTKEQGESRTPHFQVYLETEKKYRMTAIKNKLRPLGVWLEPARGGEKGRDYVMRTGDHADKPGFLEGPWEFGEYTKNQGKRSDLTTITDMIMKGSSLSKVATTSPATFVRFHTGLKALKGIINTKVRKWRTELHIITGVPGSGKSYTAKMEAEKYLIDHKLDGDVYYYNAPAKAGQDRYWFNNYDGESVMIINDFYGTVDIDTFKNWIDEYPLTVEVKNGSAQFLVKAVWVTSNTAWTNWWGDKLLSNINNRAAIQRRITTERVFNDVFQPDDVTLPAPVVYLNDKPLPNDDPVMFMSQQQHDDLDLACLESVDEALFPEDLNQQPATMYQWGDADSAICERVAQMRMNNRFEF